MTSYRVAASDRGVGYVQCDDEWAQRPTFWHPYVITSDGDNGIQWLRPEPYRTWAERSVRNFLGVQL